MCACVRIWMKDLNYKQKSQTRYEKEKHNVLLSLKCDVTATEATADIVRTPLTLD